MPSLDVLASSASPAEPLENRINWLVDLVQWVRRPGRDDAAHHSPELQIQAGRLRRFFDVLDRNPEWKRQVAQTLRSIIKETTALELFCATGLPRQFGLISETIGRAGKKLMPSPPASAELGVLFDRVFSHRGDAEWIQKLDETTLARLEELLGYEVSDEEKNWNSLGADLEDALFYLAAELRVSGGTWAIRSRIKRQNLRDLPFFNLSSVLTKTVTARAKGDTETLTAELNYLRAQLDACHRLTDEVLGHLEIRGVSTEVVYQLAFIDAILRRFETLLELVFSPGRKMADAGALVAMLVRENRARESIADLMKQNFRLMTRKIVERSAETGEHYIARTKRDYVEMLRRAGGGGVIMAFTTWFKVNILGWHLAFLQEGLVASLNYAAGFVSIQLTGSTLATKQPANTAPALAARMHQVREPKAMASLVDEIVMLIRSQFASIARQPRAGDACGTGDPRRDFVGSPRAADGSRKSGSYHPFAFVPRADDALRRVHGRAAVGVEPRGGVGGQLVCVQPHWRSVGDGPAAGAAVGDEPHAAICAVLETEHRRAGRKYFVRVHARASSPKWRSAPAFRSKSGM